MTLRHHSGADLTVWVKSYMHMNKKKLQGVRMLFHPSFFINPFLVLFYMLCHYFNYSNKAIKSLTVLTNSYSAAPGLR